MFRKLWLDVILGTLFVFGLMGLFKSASAFKIFEIFDPIADALGDFQVTDIVFSQLRNDPIADDRIVLVNIGAESRGTVGIMVDKINQHNPAALAMDTFFMIPKDTLEDMILEGALNSVDNLVMVSQMIVDDDNTVDTVFYSLDKFNTNATFAHANLDAEAESQDELKFCRQFWPRRIADDGTEHIALGIKMASYLDPEKAEKYLDRDNLIELINFKGNVMDFGASKFGTKYSALDWPDVLEENFTPEMIQGKLVIFCYLGDYLGDRKNFEDKYITPLNSVYAGRTLPDMYGGVIHANIASMVLSDDPVNHMSDFWQVTIAIILCFLNVALFSVIYKKIPKWYDGSTKLIQLIELLFFYFLMVQIFDSYNYYVDLTIALVAIALSGDALEVYYGVIKNTFTKEGRRALFKADRL
ncbi:MAG: CHASE2 domain-containing protein [Cytophagales bacterium]|nr:CHASE2 domain-containing protein [Cytophagales bacterium]